MVASRRSGRVSAGLFGWFNDAGVGELVDVGPGQLTGPSYVQILEEVLLPSVGAMLFPEPEPFYLIQDNSPVHTSRVVKEWFARHTRITVMPHPARSPDLNPIEHVWAAMQKGMPDRQHRCRATVVNDALQAWEHLRSPSGRDLTHTLVASMPRRLNEVLAEGGGYTRY